MKILYIGNKQSEFGGIISYMEFIIPYFSRFAEVDSSSGKRNFILRFLDWVLMVIRKGKKADFILLDVFSGKQFYGIFGLVLLLKLMNLKYSCILRGGRLPKRLDKNPKLSQYIFNKAQNIIAPSAYLQTEFEKKGYQCKIIPNAVESNLFLEVIENNVSLSPKLLYVRSINEVYNPLMAVKILKIIKQKFPDAFLCMVGSKNNQTYKEVLEYIKENDLKASFEYKGILTKREWFSLSKNYSIYLSTTNFDNTPVSLIEAFNLGLLVASTDVGGVPYLVTNNETGILFKPNDIDGAASKIIEIINNEQLASTILFNGFEYGKSFRIENVIYKWKELFNKL